MKRQVMRTWEIGFSTRNILHLSLCPKQKSLALQGCTVSWAGEEQHQPVLADAVGNIPTARAISGSQNFLQCEQGGWALLSPKMPVIL